MSTERCWLNEDCTLENNHEGACKFKSWFITEEGVRKVHFIGGSVDVTIEDVVQSIGRWKARRREPLHDPDKEYVYECAVRFNDEQWQTEFLVTHLYADGAGVLIGKIFARYAEIKARAAKRSKEIHERRGPDPIPKPHLAKSERLHDLEAEKDLREIRHRDQAEP